MGRELVPDYNTGVRALIRDALNKRDDCAHIRGYEAGRSLSVIQIETLEFAEERQSRLESCSLLDIINNPFEPWTARRFEDFDSRRGQPLDSVRTRNSRNSNLVSLFRIHLRISNYRVARTVKLIP